MKLPSVPLTAAVSRPVWVCIPAARAVVDMFGFSALAPVRPAIVPRRTPRCPRRFGRRLLLLRHWLCSVHRRMPRYLSGTPCRTTRRNESRAIPSLCRATPSATSERFLGLLDSRQSLRLRCFLRSFQLRSLSSAGITRLHRSYGPLRHPIRPGLALASCQLILTAITAGASRVASGPSCLHAVASTPAGLMELVRSYVPSTSAFPRLLAWIPM